MTDDAAAIQRAVTDGIREGMRSLSAEMPRAIAEAVKQAMRESPAADAQTERMSEIRDTLDRFEILLETIAQNAQSGGGA